MVEDDMPALAAAVAAPIRKLWVLKRDGLKPSDLRRIAQNFFAVKGIPFLGTKALMVESCSTRSSVAWH